MGDTDSLASVSACDQKKNLGSQEELGAPMGQRSIVLVKKK